MKFFLIVVNAFSLIIYMMTFVAAKNNGFLISTTTSFACGVMISLALLIGRNKAALSPMFLLLLINIYANICRMNFLAFDPRLMEIKYYLRFLPTELIENASLLVLLGTFSICAGYIIPASSKLNFYNPRKINFNNARIYLIMGLFAALLTLYIVTADNSASFSAKRYRIEADGTRFTFGPLRFAIQILLCCIQILLIYCWLNLKKRKLEFALLFLLLVAASFAISVRSIVFFSMLPILMLSLYKFNVKKTFGLTLITLLVMTSLFRITQLRSQTALDSSFTSKSLYEKIETTFIFGVISANYGGIIPTSISTYLIEDELEPLYGRTWFFDPVAQFVPRTYWRTKPEEIGGEIRKIHQNMGFVSRGQYGGVPPGAIAESWLNFRVWGVAGFCFFYGILLGIIFKYARSVVERNEFLLSALIILSINSTFYLYGGHVARSVNFFVTWILALLILRTLGVFQYQRHNILKKNTHPNQNFSL